jgi:diguanylate cyclase (GGDEF)-like protein/PAS domain S-box-containing protein
MPHSEVPRDLDASPDAEIAKLMPFPKAGVLASALDSSDSAILLTDDDRRICYVNEGYCRLFDYLPHEVIGRTPGDLLLRHESERGLEQFIRDGLTRDGHVHTQGMVYGRHGQPRWVSIIIDSAKSTGDPVANSITVMTDITITKMHEVLQKKVLEGMVKETPLTELMTLICSEVEHIAPEVVASILAVTEDGCLKTLAAPSMPKNVCDAINGLVIGPSVGSCGTAAWRSEPVMVTDIQNDPLWANYRELMAPTELKACWSSPIKSRQGKVVGTFAFYFKEKRLPNSLHQLMVDVCVHLCALAIEREAASARIHQLAYFDGLTGLPNRSLFKANSSRMLARMARDRTCGALIFLDLDRFKRVNDSHGHAAGDALLLEVAQRLSRCVRAQDLVGRLAGDEFVLLLTDCTDKQTLLKAQRVQQELAQPLILEGQTHVPQASLGIAFYPEDGSDIDTLLRHADQAMYQAKSERLHSIQVFSPEMNQRTQARVALETGLRQALSQGDLSLHYQPQVRADGQLHGVEALARWHHQQWGWVPPLQFIPVAEEAALMGALTDWLLDEVCRQLKQWRSAGLHIPRVAVNLSAQSFHTSDIGSLLAANLARYELKASDLMLEITESVMMDQRPVTVANIADLHRQGFLMSLDDFGTGYSSLSYLHRLPISELKLDKSFVQDLEQNVAAQALTRSVMGIAQSLNMTMVAEGVETARQRDWLNQCGCPVMQGYFFSHPLPPAELARWVQQRT